MRISGKGANCKKVIVRVILSFAMILSVISAMPVGSVAKASSGTIQYNNKVFTKKLYKNTKKIGFGSDGSQVIQDKKTVKKVYALLAKMELKVKNQTQWRKAGMVL